MKRSFESIVAASQHALNVALRPKILWLSLLSITLLVSAGASLSMPFRRAAVIWFPDSRSADGSDSRPELRTIRVYRDVAAQAGAIVEEMLLGPLNASSRPISVPSARLLSSIRSKKTLYVDISSDILFGRTVVSGVYEAPSLQPRVALEYIERSLRWNFPLFTIILTVDGLEPVWRPPLSPKET